VAEAVVSEPVGSEAAGSEAVDFVAVVSAPAALRSEAGRLWSAARLAERDSARAEPAVAKPELHNCLV
jgi:hypothetical protein